MKNIFDQADTSHFIKRINALTEDSFPKWGVMSVDKMLAHCNVTYELIYEQEKHKKPNRLIKWVLTKFVKPKVVNETPYKHNSPTAAMFVITDNKSFEEEKKRIIGFIQKTQQLGADAFEGKESFNFGKLTATEWNNMMSKHLDHHLTQFGV
ncbi:DUF1569 domain-containing protein [Epilithonimonas arachidiradicis]|uniref:Uncharacterized protein DUF1569 n=1 Tax=Epilithonimonas arachidiradicis TaxID=1617282 RepID=A0A420DBI3_9FLAO|nr:DUF1569 domain-containing protein [Epilithonimonas arachidiradicis]RKE88916.1 uncharacterized protein DUF1569 [Epilithonimonas arachidiradicis]GGG54045.1 hypothetical protein GCM10007332_14620 [Epilithonimonas arachidiradicis]